MKRIHILVLKSYLGPMFLTFFIVMFVLMMNFVWRYIDELVGKGLDAPIIIELMSYAMVNMIPLGLPLSLLLAAIMTMGNLGENYELLAMKSAGMSLLRIIEPLIYVIAFISVGSFFIVNDLVPYSNKKMYSIIYDIRRQKQVIEFKDGLFFNGIENMSIRVGKQDPKTKLLRDVLIYDNRAINGDMTTTVADSGYIRLSDDKSMLLVTLFNGHTYEQTRSASWYNKSELRHNKFETQYGALPMEGFSMDQRTDSENFKGSQTMTITELQDDIDSLRKVVNTSTVKSYEPLLKQQIFARDHSVLLLPDSLMVDKQGMAGIMALDSIDKLDLRSRQSVWSTARRQAKNSRNMFTHDEASTKQGLKRLYLSQVEWHRKLTTPISIIIFFLIGAPLGAIIRKGGLGMPIVVSVIFFVIYYIISLTGEKMAKEGTWVALGGMWFSAYILTPVAIYLTYKANSDSALFDRDPYIKAVKKLVNLVIPKRLKKSKKAGNS
ncbi:MAG: LptF/LptG family permease [Rikenellaceae bacterium]